MGLDVYKSEKVIKEVTQYTKIEYNKIMRKTIIQVNNKGGVHNLCGRGVSAGFTPATYEKSSSHLKSCTLLN